MEPDAQGWHNLRGRCAMGVDAREAGKLLKTEAYYGCWVSTARGDLRSGRSERWISAVF